MIAAPPALEIGAAAVSFAESLGPSGLAGLLISSGVVGAVAKALIDKYKPRVERESFALAEAKTVWQELRELRTEHDEDRKEWQVERRQWREGQDADRRRMDDQDRRIEEQSKQIEDLRTTALQQSRSIYTLRAAVETVRRWWQDEVVARWEQVRQLPDPPQFPTIHIDEEH